MRKKDSPKFPSIHEIYWGEKNQSQKLHKSNKNVVSKGVVIPDMDLMIEDVYNPYKLHWLMDINNVLVPQQCNNVLYQFTLNAWFTYSSGWTSYDHSLSTMRSRILYTLLKDNILQYTLQLMKKASSLA